MKMHCVHYSGTVKPFNHQRREVSWLSSECVSVQSLTCFCERPPNQKKKCSRVSLRALAFDEKALGAGWELELLLKARRGMMQQICNDCNTHSRA